MDNDRLLEFIRLIALSKVGTGPLEELADILKNQGEMDKAALVRKIIYDFPEVQSAVSDQPLTDEQLKIAHRRADERRRREDEAGRNGRC